MAALGNPKHERFAQELAKGKSQADAYVSAGYKHSRSAAARLAADVSICARVAEIAERVAVRTEITAASIAERLMRIADVAEKTGIGCDEGTGEPRESSSKHLSVARAALMDVAQLNGLVVKRNELTGKDGAPIQTEAVGELSALPQEKRDAIRAAIKAAMSAA